MLSNILVLFVLIVLSAFFSASETAILSISRFRVRQLLQKGSTRAAALQKLKDNPHRTLTLILICNNVTNITASVLAADIALKQFGNIGVSIVAGAMTLIILIFGEITPKLFAQTHADFLALAVARPLYMLGIILSPLVALFDQTLPRLFRLKNAKSHITEEELKTILDVSREEGTIDHDELVLLKNLFKFDDKTAGIIKTPRSEMVCIPSGKTVKEFVDLALAKGHSRIPIYGKNRDELIGVALLKEVLPVVRAGQWNVPIETLAQKLLFVPPTKKIDELLRLMQRKQRHMAIIVDEFGGVKGLVTMEDILEEIVGEIMDETERVEPLVRQEEKGSWLVLGKTPIGELNRKLKISIPEDEAYDTVGGFVIHTLGRVPKEGHSVEQNGTRFTVLRMGQNRVLEVRVQKP